MKITMTMGMKMIILAIELCVNDLFSSSISLRCIYGKLSCVL